jgi:hypothetical protein
MDFCYPFLSCGNGCPHRDGEFNGRLCFSCRSFRNDDDDDDDDDGMMGRSVELGQRFVRRSRAIY